MAPALTIDQEIEIIDIRGNENTISLAEDVTRGLCPDQRAEKQLPTMLFYDEKGLQLFEEITYLEEYYLTNAEIDALERYAGRIAERIPHGAQVIELGSGNLRKVNILLKALERAERDVDYYALDLSYNELWRTLSEVPSGTYRHVRCRGLHGTYEDGLKWLKRAENCHRPRCIMSLGSSVGNFNLQDASKFLHGFAAVLGQNDSILVGVDSTNLANKVFTAYNDKIGLTEQFYRNGLEHANRLLGQSVFDQEDWDVIGVFNKDKRRHEAFIAPRKDIVKGNFLFVQGERIRIEEAYKFSSVQKSRLWRQAGLQTGATFTDSTGDYSLNMVSASEFRFPTDPLDYAPTAVPDVKDWEALWSAWDMVTRQMIPEEELLSKPINLRNCCLFYLGHIPTFLDIYLSRATGGKPTEPSSFVRIFERGIDPDVENPELCHDHSEIPDEWPPLDEILRFQENVRVRTRRLYKHESSGIDRNIGRALWLGYEHEAMHLETLLYMLLQSDKTVPPPGVKPDFESIAYEARTHEKSIKWIDIPSRKISTGIEDPEDNDGLGRYYGWDNEKPVRSSSVPAFQAQPHAITNEDYARYLIATSSSKTPASWSTDLSSSSKSNGISTVSLNGTSFTTLPDSFLHGKTVKSVYGPCALQHALDWPVMASYDELAGCAKWMGGRIPTEEEARSLYAHIDEIDGGKGGEVDARGIPAVNGHLSNNGVQETPPSANSSKPRGLDPLALFADLSSANVAFKHFHPIPVQLATPTVDGPAGRAGLGGVWEWTSTTLAPWEGFKEMDLYPGYTADFFDGKHNVVLGGSWATVPRIAGRRSFVNWYQRSYPYAWIGARVVRGSVRNE